MERERAASGGRRHGEGEREGERLGEGEREAGRGKKGSELIRDRRVFKTPGVTIRLTVQFVKIVN